MFILPWFLYACVLSVIAWLCFSWQISIYITISIIILCLLCGAFFAGVKLVNEKKTE